MNSIHCITIDHSFHVFTITIFNIESSLVESEMTLTNQKWDDQLKTKTSKMYKNLVTYLTVEVGT